MSIESIRQELQEIGYELQKVKSSLRNKEKLLEIINSTRG